MESSISDSRTAQKSVEYAADAVGLLRTEFLFHNRESLPGEEEQVASYFEDPTMSSYYKVSNFQTNAEVRDSLWNHLSDAVIDEVFHDDFLEYEGALYLRRGSRGYGAVTIDLDSLKFVEQKNDRYYVTVDYLLFEEYDETMLLEFENRDGHWILSDKEKYV